MNNEQRLLMNLPYWTQDNPETRLATPRLTDEVYAASSSSYVLLCVEIVLVYRVAKTFLLPWRRRKPCVGWWYFGGRVGRGETEHQAARRVLQREAGLVLKLDRFQYVRQHRLICDEREEIPQDAGADYLSFQFVVEVTPAELMTASTCIDGREFDKEKGLAVFIREDLVAQNIHHSIITLYDTIFPAL